MFDTAPTPNHPNPVDLHVGGRVRIRRKLLGLSQEALAEAIGLTFQQVQKYERGANRISSSKLYEIAQTLKVPVQYFFEGYGEGATAEAPGETELAVHDFLMTTEGVELAQCFPLIPSAALRRRVLELVRTMAGQA